MPDMHARDAPPAAAPDRRKAWRRAAADLAAALPLLLLVTLTTRAVFDLPASYLWQALGLYAGLCALVLATVPPDLPGRGLGAANRVTLGRAMVTLASGGALFMALSMRSAGLAAAPVTGHGFEPFSDFGRRDGEFLVVGALDRSHPALQSMDDVRRARFYRHVAVQPQDGDRVLMRLDEGGPLLLEHTLGAGRVMLYGSSLDREWNDLPVQPVFVPMIAQLGGVPGRGPPGQFRSAAGRGALGPGHGIRGRPGVRARRRHGAGNRRRRGRRRRAGGPDRLLRGGRRRTHGTRGGQCRSNGIGPGRDGRGRAGPVERTGARR